MSPGKKASIRKTQRFLISLGVLPVLLAFFAYRTSSQHVASVMATLSTQDFIRKLDELLSTIQDAETGQRGYLLTGEDRYLTPFDEAVANLPKRLSDIDALAAVHGLSSRDVSKLHTAIKDKMTELQKTVDQHRQGNQRAALAEVATGSGQRYMTRIRSLIAALKDEETTAFRRRLEQQERSQRELEIVLATGVLMAFLLVYTVYGFNAAYVRGRDQVEEEIRALNNSLESRVKERTALLEARTAELQRSNADLTEFAYIASHDLQEPLRMVGSYMGLLARRYTGKLDDTADRYITFAVDGANRMQALINDLLVYSRAGTQTVEKSPVSSEEIVRVVLENLAVPIKESSAIVRYGNLPVVEADETKLTQVVQNLIGNALKFRNDEVNPEISVKAQRRDGEWLFAIADNGIGFDPTYSDRIFQIFQRLHGQGKYPGNGIGLAICRRIIEHHGGRLWAESQLEVGSTFYFTLPIATDQPNNESDMVHRPLRSVPQPVSHA